MGQFRQKPIEIEAVRCSDLLHAFEHDWSALPSWAEDAYEKGIICAARREDLTIKTLVGDRLASRDDWIIRGANGELHPVPASTFAETYESVE